MLGIHARPLTVRAYSFWLDHFHESLRKPIDEASIYDVAKYARIIKLKYSSKSVELSLTVIKRYLIHCRLHGWTRINPEELRVPKGYGNPHDPLTAEEYVSMLSFIHADTALGVRDNLLIRMLYDTGARIGELQQFNRLIADHNQRFLRIETLKTTDHRFIKWGKDTDVFLTTWQEIRDKRPIFPSIRSCERLVRKYALLAGIDYKHITCHSFRHTKGHMILDNGGTVKHVQEILGHRSPISSFAYLRWNEDKRMEQHERFLDKNLKTPPFRYTVGDVGSNEIYGTRKQGEKFEMV